MKQAAPSQAHQTALDLTGVPEAVHFAGRADYLRELQTHLDPLKGDWRAAVIYGLGGMGKTALAARLARRLEAHLDGVKAMRMAPSTTAKAVFDQLTGYLLVHNAVFNDPRIPGLAGLWEQPLALENKLAPLIQVLCQHRLLVIFDNYEDVLEGGQTVSQAAQKEAAALDPDLPRLVRLLIEGVAGPSRFLFTSRRQFDPLDNERLPGVVGFVSLGELPFREAVYLMETLPPLE